MRTENPYLTVVVFFLGVVIIYFLFEFWSGAMLLLIGLGTTVWACFVYWLIGLATKGGRGGRKS